MRLIDADALKKHYAWWEDDKQKLFDSIVDQQPTVETAPVRHGKWIIRDNPGTGWYRITCSECGENVTSEAPCIGFLPNAKVTWDYCPNCGADMRGEDSEHE